MSRLIVTPFPVLFTQWLICLAIALTVSPLAGAAVDDNTAKRDAFDRIVAIVNDDVITQTELEFEMDAVKQQLRQQQTAVPPDNVLQKQVLERLIMMRIQLQRAERRLLRVDDESLNQAIENIAQQNGLNLAQFRRALESSGLSYKEYRERIRDEMIISRLQQRQVQRKINVTDQEISDFLANRDLQGRSNEEYHLQHILFEVPEAASAERIQAAKQKANEVLKQLKEGADFTQMAIANSDGQQALNGGDIGWRKLPEIPSLFADLVVNMEKGGLSDLIRSPSGFHIIKLTDKRSEDKQHIVEQTRARHILIQPNDGLSEAAAKDRLIQLKQRIDAGESFEKIATAHSDDKGSAADGGNLGWVNPGTMVKEFEDAMNELQPGEVSEPVKTRFGWHLIRVEDRRKHDNTEDFLHKQAREYLRQQKLGPALQTWLRQIKDESFVEVRL
ncbi:MAG: peptidylprolyl isomerase [Gammaproteobacteria bacterium]|jgi:peptidyl-prolyl cis-trans isomerase SurA